MVDAACLQEPLEKIDKPSALHASPHVYQKQPVMDRVEVAGQITFDDPAARRRVGSILKLYPYGADGVMHAPFRPEAVG